MAQGGTLIGLGVIAAAAGLGWWLVGRRKVETGPPEPEPEPEPVLLTEPEAAAFALSWAQTYESLSGLNLVAQTRIRYFTGQPPRLSDADWLLVEGTPTSTFWYVEFRYTDPSLLSSFLTVMIDGITGEKPPLGVGWVVDRMNTIFGL